MNWLLRNSVTCGVDSANPGFSSRRACAKCSETNGSSISFSFPIARNFSRMPSRIPSCASQRCTRAISRISGSPAERSTTWSTARRGSSESPLESVPAADQIPPVRRASVVNSLRASSISDGRLQIPRAVAPSANLRSDHRNSSTRTRCDLPDPKKPLTHTAGCDP